MNYKLISSNSVTRYTFSGKERDEETGYSYFGARHYPPRPLHLAECGSDGGQVPGSESVCVLWKQSGSVERPEWGFSN